MDEFDQRYRVLTSIASRTSPKQAARQDRIGQPSFLREIVAERGGNPEDSAAPLARYEAVLAERDKLAAELAAKEAEIARLKQELRLARDHGSY